jgi:methylenetetrahydrofolate dehydrogenase (NAD+)
MELWQELHREGGVSLLLGAILTSMATEEATALPPAVKIDVTAIAQPFRDEVRTAISEKYGGVGPRLVGFLANKVGGYYDPPLGCHRASGCASRGSDLGCLACPQDPAAKKYAEWTGRACAADGIRYELREVCETDLEEALYLANEDPTVHGIMIYYPVFGGWPGGD